MGISDWKERELEHLSQLWELRPAMPQNQHTREMWNERAKGWEQGLRENKKRQNRSRRRVEATAKYLIGRGVLTPETNVIDIGCGPGRFVAEFAKTAKHASGLDISDAMTQYGQAFCTEMGLSNVSFYALDFKTMDVEAEGMKERFDLVFSSITPAIGNKAGYEKALAMTNGWFFNANFITIKDSLSEALEEKTGLCPVRSRDGAGGYCMINELMLKGYYPELNYFEESATDEYTPEEALAEYLPWFFREGASKEQEETFRKVLEGLADPDGIVRAEKQWVYVWTLADKQNRNIYDR